MLLAADIGGLGSGVNDMVLIGGQFLHDIRPCFQSSNREGAVGTGLISANDRPAGARAASQILDPEGGTLHGGPGNGVVLVDHQSGEGRVLKGQHLGGARLDIALLGSAVLDSVARLGGQLGYLVPSVFQPVKIDLAALVGGIGTQVVDFPGRCAVRGIGHGELNALDGVAGDGVQLIDGQTGFLMVLKGHVPILVGIEGHRLGGSVLEVGGRDGLLHHLIYAREHIVDSHLALFVCGDFRNGVTVRDFDHESGAGDGFIGVSVGLVDGQVGAAVIFQLHGGRLPHLQLHMMLSGVQDIVRQRGSLTDGQHPRLQPL